MKTKTLLLVALGALALYYWKKSQTNDATPALTGVLQNDQVNILGVGGVQPAAGGVRG